MTNQNHQSLKADLKKLQSVSYMRVNAKPAVLDELQERLESIEQAAILKQQGGVDVHVGSDVLPTSFNLKRINDELVCDNFVVEGSSNGTIAHNIFNEFQITEIEFESLVAGPGMFEKGMVFYVKNTQQDVFDLELESNYKFKFVKPDLVLQS